MQIMNKIRVSILDMAEWAARHLENLIILVGVLIMSFILLVLLSWAVGYYANGLWGMKFELNSVWQGLGACVTAITGLLTMAGVQLGKHYVDSRYNSNQGEKPRGGNER